MTLGERTGRVFYKIARRLGYSEGEAIPMKLLFPTESLSKAISAGVDKYQKATPFPHIVIDNFLHPMVLKRVLKEFPETQSKIWESSQNDTEIKLSQTREYRFGETTRQLIYTLNSASTLVQLENLTGIKGLIPDPHLRGGGLHQIVRGGKLGIHADFNYYEHLGLYRRLNLLIYLNRGWKEEWGGNLELWDKDLKTCLKRVEPLFNRAVLFDTSNYSFHGHPNPLNTPDTVTRKSLALYYYTVDYPYEEDRKPRSTVFRSPQPQNN